MRKPLNILLCFIMLLALCACGRGRVEPVEPPSPEDQEEGREFSTPYESSVYHDRLNEVVLTGNYATDLLCVAFSQEGYHEGDVYAEIHGGSADGSGNRTEYGRHTGTNGQPWCASFISWCAWRAKIPEDVICPGIHACADSLGVEYYGREECTPKAGDFVIFDWLKDGLNEKEPASEYGDHIGIVYRVTDTTLYYIDGNGSDEMDRDSNRVMRHSRPIDDENIKGYGVYTDEPADMDAVLRAAGEGPDTDETPKTYGTSVYYERLKAVELTGNCATDLLDIAFSQLGYHEGDSFSEMHGYASGSGNYTEYGRYMGVNGQPWCACFISWCAHMAEIPEDVICPAINACADSFGVEYFGRDEYTPKPGDLVIFDWLKNGLNEKEPAAEYGDHIGIVYRVTDTEMYYINGNGPDLNDEDTNCVACFCRPLDDGNIKGYGVYTDEPADTSALQ